MNANDIVSLAGIVALGLVGVYFSFKYRHVSKNQVIKMTTNDIISISLGIVFIIAGTYFNYKFNQIGKENEIDTKKAHQDQLCVVVRFY